MADPDTRLIRFVGEVMECYPAVRQHFSDLLMEELTEELHRRGAKDAAQLVQEINQDWSNDA
jgi:hypothetical protein